MMIALITYVVLMFIHLTTVYVAHRRNREAIRSINEHLRASPEYEIANWPLEKIESTIYTTEKTIDLLEHAVEYLHDDGKVKDTTLPALLILRSTLDALNTAYVRSLLSEEDDKFNQNQTKNQTS